MNGRVKLKWGAALAVLAAAITVPLVLGSTGGAAPSFPLSPVLKDPFADGLGYHASAEEPSIFAAKNPARAGSLHNKSTIVATEQVGRVYDGGASDIGYQVSVNGGQSWKHGELPLTIQSGQTTTCGGPLSRASDTVTVYDQRHDVWIISTLGLSGNASVPAVYVNRGTANFTTGDVDWGPPICEHITQPASDSPDKNWITCDNWPNSKGYGNCYVEWDNNGNGNREIMQRTSDGGLTWDPAPTVSASASGLPGNGNTGDVTGETTLLGNAAGFGVAAHAGDTNIKVASVTGIGTTLSAATAAAASNIKVASIAVFKATTLAAAANAGDTNIKVASVQNLLPGQTLNIDTGAGLESRVIAPNGVGTAGATGTGVTLTSGLGSAHASAAPVTVAGQTVNVDTGANLETMTVQVVGTAGAAGTGVTLTAPLTLAHASAAQVNTPIKVEVDFSGGNQEVVLPTNVGTAGLTGTGITFTPALAIDHTQAVHVANAAAAQAGHTGDIGGVPLVQPPPPGSPPGSVCGRVITPVATNGVSWWSSNDCGAHYSAETQILPSMTATHGVAQGIRTSLLPTSAMDGAGNIYVVWQTRSFRTASVASTPNDIAMSVMPAPTVANPNPSFGAPVRIPIEADNTNANTNDHFIPGISADQSTSGATAHLGLYYYNYPVAACSYVDPTPGGNQCDLRMGFVSSTNGGATWSAPTQLAHMAVPNIVRSSQGPMVGDYSSADVIPSGPFAGNSISAFAVGITDTSLNQGMYVATHGMPITGGTTATQPASPAAVKQALAFQARAHNVPPVLRTVP